MSDDQPTRNESLRSSREDTPTLAGDPPIAGSQSEDLPTQASRGGSQPSGYATGSRVQTMRSAGEFMANDESQRLNTFSFAMLFVCVGGAACLVVLDGDPLATRIAAGGLVFVALGFLFTWWKTRTERIVNEALVHRLVVVQALAASPIGYFFGVWSPFPAILSTAILVHALSAPPKYSALSYVATAGGWLLLCILVATDVVIDRGFIQALEMDTATKTVGLLAVQMIFAACYFVGLKSRRRTEQTVAAFEDAVRQVSAREALLREARLELERAVAVGGPGRFTGQTIGNYMLDILIGRGGMGEIYAARQVHTGEAAAVKLLQRGSGSGADPIERFAREAKLVASLDSPHVVAVRGIGGPEAPLPYLAMERLVGHDLGWHLREIGRLKRTQLVALASQVALGLEAARAAKIVHRDLKPQNLFLTENGTWKILDFGVSRLAGASSTQTAGQVVGTPAYMAPEQVTARVLDHRVDLYALGVILYRAVTGRPAFSGRETQAVIEKVLTALPPAPSTVRKVPVAVDHVLRLAMAKDPGDRFDTAVELADAFTEAIRGRIAPELERRSRALNIALAWE